MVNHLIKKKKIITVFFGNIFRPDYFSMQNYNLELGTINEIFFEIYEIISLKIYSGEVKEILRFREGRI